MDLEFHQLDLRYEKLRIAHPGRVSRLAGLLEKEGQQSPVSVIESAGDRYVLIDGYLRVRALRNLGRDTVRAMVLPLSEVEALVMAHRLDRSVKRTVMEESWLLRELRETHGLTLQELAGRLDRSVSWVSRRLALVRDLPDSVQDLVRRGVLCAHAAMKYLVPLARAKKSDCDRLASSIGERGLSSRQVERLYKAWRLGDPEQRSRIIENPTCI